MKPHSLRSCGVPVFAEAVAADFVFRIEASLVSVGLEAEFAAQPQGVGDHFLVDLPQSQVPVSG